MLFSLLNLPAPLLGCGPQQGRVILLPLLGTKKAKGQGPPGHSSVQSFKISFT